MRSHKPLKRPPVSAWRSSAGSCSNPSCHRSHSPEVATATDRVADRYLETLDAARVAGRIRALLIGLLPSGETAAERIARELHLSVSTLQRQLGGEGLTYRDVLDDTRRSLAEGHLRDGKLPHAQIAYLLGVLGSEQFLPRLQTLDGAESHALSAELGHSPADWAACVLRAAKTRL